MLPVGTSPQARQLVCRLARLWLSLARLLLSKEEIDFRVNRKSSTYALEIIKKRLVLRTGFDPPQVGGYRDATPVNGASVGDLPHRGRNGRFHFGATTTNSLSLRGQTTSSSSEIGMRKHCAKLAASSLADCKRPIRIRRRQHSVHGQLSVPITSPSCQHRLSAGPYW
jgi:hypothetical protein